MTDLIKRDDALAACDIVPPDEWHLYSRDGYEFAAHDCIRNIAALPAIDPAAMREAALREAYEVVYKWWVYGGRARPQELILALIGEKK